MLPGFELAAMAEVAETAEAVETVEAAESGTMLEEVGMDALFDELTADWPDMGEVGEQVDPVEGEISAPDQTPIVEEKDDMDALFDELTADWPDMDAESEPVSEQDMQNAIDDRSDGSAGSGDETGLKIPDPAKYMNGEGNAESEQPSDSSENAADADENNNETSESKPTRELTQDEINEKQREAIKEAFEKIARGEKLSDQEKGNLCEMMMDQYYISKGYTPLHERITSLDDKVHLGIDGVYERKNSDGKTEYVIADAKYGSSPLSTTVDNTRQMSDEWIDKRLDDAVGKEKADEIRDAYEDNPNNVHHEVYHYSPNPDENGNTNSDVTTVDPEGNKNNDKEVVESFDENGNIIHLIDETAEGE